MNQQTLSICIIIIGLFVIFVNIIIFIKMMKLMTKFQQMSYNLFMLKEDVNENHLDITESIETLQTSVADTLKDIRRQAEEEIYPMPQLSEMITATIAEQIHLHTRLNANRNIVPKEDFKNIIIAVCKTYPNVSEEFIVQKTISIIESMNNS